MANIIRVKLPDGVHRFSPFTVKDYRDFILIRNDIVTNSADEVEIVDELLEELFAEYPKPIRGYIFLNVFTSSIGKSKIPLEYTCPDCGKKHKMLLNLAQPPLENPTIEVSGIKLTFERQEMTAEYDKMFMESIRTVESNGEVYGWDSLSPEDQEKVIEAVTYEAFEELLTKMKPFNIQRTIKCCQEYKLSCETPLDLFKMIINPDEIFTFYRVNHILTKSDYALSDVMNMIPIERNIALGLIEKDKSK